MINTHTCTHSYTHIGKTRAHIVVMCTNTHISAYTYRPLCIYNNTHQFTHACSIRPIHSKVMYFRQASRHLYVLSVCLRFDLFDYIRSGLYHDLTECGPAILDPFLPFEYASVKRQLCAPRR